MKRANTMSRAAPTLIPLAVLICLALYPAAASAQAVAILEEIAGATGGHEAFDELKAGERIELGQGGRAMIGYFGSCTRERIAGGTVVIGKDQSQVDGGSVERETIACEATQLALTGEEAGQSGAVTFRPALPAIPSPSPVILADGKTVTITRLDGDEKPITVPLKNRHVDLAVKKITLTPGGIYKVTAGKKKTVIQIDAGAVAGPMPAMSRLVRL